VSFVAIATCSALACGSDDDSNGKPGGKDAGADSKTDSTATGGTSGDAATGGAGAGGTAGSGGTAGDAASDACVDCPTGWHFGYVLSEMKVPTSSPEADQLSLDLDGDGNVDNQFGKVLATLMGQGFDIQGSNDEAIARGHTLTLFDFQAPSFTSASGAALTMKIGANPNPAACTDPNDLATCGKHLAGTATFDIAPSSPTDRVVQGPIDTSVFKGGPGNLFIQLAIAGTTPIKLDLVGARVEAKNPSATGLDEVILAGGILKTEIDTAFLPDFATQLQAAVTQDCPGTAGACGCASDSTGKTILSLFDADNDCVVTVAELKSDSLMNALLAPDIKIDGADALSFGVKLSAVQAKFPGIDP